MAVLAHQPFIYGELSGLENLRFFARLYERAHDEAHLLALLDRVGLKLAARRAARTYSRGMFQRLALARILVQDADVWLLDEPTTGLDEAGRALFAEVVSEARGQGRCLVLVTHDPSLVAATTDRLYRLDNGRLRGGEEPQ
jgi:heme exporter protein A